MPVFPVDLAALNDAILAPFEESIVYRPAAGGTRTITADVVRVTQDAIGVENATTPRITVTVRNNATTGITATEIDNGGDQVDVATHYGGSAVSRYIGTIITTDQGMVQFEVR